MKNPWWRPSKIEKFVIAFENLLKDNESDVIILTDAELRVACNELLNEDDRISKRTFERWKNKETIEENPELIDEELENKYKEEQEKFWRLYKKALINQKRELYKAVAKWDNNWQSRSWIIERKFDEWNLRNIGVNKNDNTNLNIEAKPNEIESLKSVLQDNDLI